MRKALDVAEIAFADGYAPFVPHLTMFWDAVHPHDEADWMDWCMAYVAVADRVYWIAGESRGADREVEFARSLGIEIVQVSS